MEIGNGTWTYTLLVLLFIVPSMSIINRNVEELTRFSGLAQKKQLSYSTKQLIAREVLI